MVGGSVLQTQFLVRICIALQQELQLIVGKK